MTRLGTATQEGVLGLKYAGASLVGFAVDAALLHLLVGAGMEAAWARVISLFTAMQVTFLINGLQVFRTLHWAGLPHQWARYVLTNGFGNFCNYWIFVTLVSLHARVVSVPVVALCAASACAWAINYASCRFLVFGRALRLAAVGLRTLRRRWRDPRPSSGPSQASPATPPQ